MLRKILRGKEQDEEEEKVNFGSLSLQVVQGNSKSRLILLCRG